MTWIFSFHVKGIKFQGFPLPHNVQRSPPGATAAGVALSNSWGAGAPITGVSISAGFEYDVSDLTTRLAPEETGPHCSRVVPNPTFPPDEKILLEIKALWGAERFRHHTCQSVQSAV